MSIRAWWRKFWSTSESWQPWPKPIWREIASAKEPVIKPLKLVK